MRDPRDVSVASVLDDDLVKLVIEMLVLELPWALVLTEEEALTLRGREDCETWTQWSGS